MKTQSKKPTRKPRKVGPIRRVRYLLEYIFLSRFSNLIGALPEGAAARLGRFCGRLIYRLNKGRRGRAIRNIERALGSELTRDEVRQLARQTFQSFGLTVTEMVWANQNLTPDELAERCPLEGAEPLEQALATGRGALLASMHLGNWELFGARCAYHFGEATALARPPTNPYLAKRIARLREKMGIKLLSTLDGARPIVRALKNGEWVGILIDQHVRRAAAPALFFGHPAYTSTVVPSLALRLKVPVFIGWDIRIGQTFEHRARIEGPVELVRTGDHEADILANTQLLNDLLEEKVREHPEQWYWHDRRWKSSERLERRADSWDTEAEAKLQECHRPRKLLQEASANDKSKKCQEQEIEPP
ncbi:MAG: lysophospholipid acyltransferase family protein [Planctomycetota bacterium]